MRSRRPFVVALPLLALVTLGASRCPIKVPSIPSYEAAAALVDQACSAAPDSKACNEAKANLATWYPNGKPTPAPTVEPTAPPTPPPTPGPVVTPPPTSGQVIDFGKFDLAFGGPAVTKWSDAVKAAEIAAHPDHCDAGRCLLNVSLSEWNDMVCAEMLKTGFACGHTGTDEITVGDSPVNDGDQVQNVHIYVGAAPQATVLWPPQALRNSWRLKAKAEQAATPTPGPSQPTPSPAQTDDAKLCASDGGPVPRNDGQPATPWNIEKISQGACGFCKGRCDHTPRVWAGKDDGGDQEHHYCWLIGSRAGDRGNMGCPARLEGPKPEVRAACERVLLHGGPPLFKCSDGSEPLVCIGVEGFEDNPFQAACASGALLSCTHDGAFCWNAEGVLQ